MGNRAVITFKSMPSVGIYLHWNGGPESILAFCDAAKLRGARNPKSDSTYAFAGLASTVGLYMHDNTENAGAELLSYGIGPTSRLDCDNYDNGQYIIGDNFNIVGRKFTTDGAFLVADLDKQQRARYAAIIESILERDGIIPESEARELDQSQYDLAEIAAQA